MEKCILFGAGYFGREALKEYGRERIEFFVDNDILKKGKMIDGIEVRLFSECIEEIRDLKIIICTRFYADVIRQLERNGICNYSIYSGLIERKSYYGAKELIENPYEKDESRALSEEEWIEKNNGESKEESIRAKVEQYVKTDHLFHHIEIETINRCNGTCDFCPVNCLIDPREKRIMDEPLFKKIIDELEAMNYSGRIALFSNNEPLLDRRIMEFHRYARKKLPRARMHLYTNGTLLTLEIFKELVEILDELIIDNYQQELELIDPCKMIVEYYNDHPEIKEKVTIVLRKPKEILTSRGGDAPNRTKKIANGTISCVLPFQQMIIRPDGKVSLCCNDPLGKCTLGDTNNQTLLEIWNGVEFKEIRKKLLKGRANLEHCKYCDVYVID